MGFREKGEGFCALIGSKPPGVALVLEAGPKGDSGWLVLVAAQDKGSERAEVGDIDNYGMKLGEMFWGGRRQVRRRVSIQTPGSCGFIQFLTLQRGKRQD